MHEFLSGNMVVPSKLTLNSVALLLDLFQTGKDLFSFLEQSVVDTVSDWIRSVELLAVVVFEWVEPVSNHAFGILDNLREFFYPFGYNSHDFRGLDEKDSVVDFLLGVLGRVFRNFAVDRVPGVFLDFYSIGSGFHSIIFAVV